MPVSPQRSAAAQATAQPLAPAPQSALRHREYAILWGGAVTSNTGRWMQHLTVPFVLFEITGSATWVGAAAFASLVPNVLVTPIAGAVADRVSRRGMLLVANGIGAALATTLALAWAGGSRSPLLILVLGALSSLVGAGSQPAWHAIIVEVVPPDTITSAVSLNSMQVSGAKTVGPAIGGAVLAAFGPTWAFAGNAASFAAILLALWLVRPPATSRESRPAARLLREIRDGAEHLWRHDEMRRAFRYVVAVTFLANPLQQLVAPLAVGVFGAGPGAIGALSGAYGLGSIIGAALVPRFAGRDIGSGPIILALTALGAFVAASVLVPTVVLSVAFFFLQGIVYMVALSSLLSIFHLNTDPSIRGRVVSLFLVGFTGFLGVGSLVQSAAADAFGLAATVATAGVMLFTFGVVGLIQGRQSRSVDTASPPA